MNVKSKRTIEWGVVLAIFLVCGLLWWPLLTGPVGFWEQGHDIPRTPPTEDRRVHNPMGFSMVAPPRWGWEHGSSEPCTHFMPKKSISARSAVIGVRRLGDAPEDLSDLAKIQFQSRPAWYGTKAESAALDDPPSFLYWLVFERSDEFWQLTYAGPAEDGLLPHIVWEYFATFRVE